jgi:hypothetical protein
VGTLALDAEIAKNFAEFGRFVFGDDAEAGAGIAHRRAEFDGLKSGVGKLFDGAGKILADGCPDGVGLTRDRHAKRIGGEIPRSRGQDSGEGGVSCRFPEEISSRNCAHTSLPMRLQNPQIASIVSQSRGELMRERPK